MAKTMTTTTLGDLRHLRRRGLRLPSRRLLLSPVAQPWLAPLPMPPSLRTSLCLPAGEEEAEAGIWQARSRPRSTSARATWVGVKTRRVTTSGIEAREKLRGRGTEDWHEVCFVIS